MSKFLSRREKSFIDKITTELINSVIQQSAIYYKINSEYTDENDIYGESSSKIFYSGVSFYALIEFLEPEIFVSNQGLNQTREITIFAQKHYLSKLGIFVEEGDFIYWDNQYFEITKTLDIKNLHGLPDKKITIQIEAKSSDLSQVNVIERK